MTQRVTIEGVTYDVMHIFDKFEDCTVAHLRKIEPPKEKESDKAWRDVLEACDADTCTSMTEARMWCRKFARSILDCAKAEIREELPEMLKELGK